MICTIIIVAACALVWSVPAKADAGQPAVSVDLVGGDSLSTLPGTVVTAVYRITAEAEEVINLDPHLTLPDGWFVVGNTEQIIITPSRPTVRFISYRIPDHARSALYHINLDLQLNQEIVASASVDISVEPVFGLALDADPIPSYAAAGAPVRTALRVTNRGNSTVTVDLDYARDKYAAVEMSSSSLRLEPQKHSEIDILITSDAGIDRTRPLHIRLEAILREHPATRESRTIAFDVVPVYARMRPMTSSVPVTVSLESAGDEKGLAPQASLNTRFKAAGGKVSVRAAVAGKDRHRTFASRNEFSVTYERDNLTVRIGDHHQSISPMTTTGQRGAGLGLIASADKWHMKATAQKSRHVFPRSSRVGVATGYRVTPSSTISANLLQRNGLYTGTVLSARAEFKPIGSNSLLDIECGVTGHRSLQDPSCHIAASVAGRQYSLRVRGLSASPDYPGSRAATRRISQSGMLRLTRSLRFEESVRFQSRSFTSGAGRDDSFIKTGVGYSSRVRKATIYSAAHFVRRITSYVSRGNHLSRIENLLRISGGIDMRRIGLSTYLTTGAASVPTSTGQQSMRHLRLQGRLTPFSGVSITGSYEQESGMTFSTVYALEREQIGIGLSIQPGDKTKMSVSGYRSNVSGPRQVIYSSVRARLRRSFRAGHQLIAQAQFNTSTGRSGIRTSDYRVAYVMPFNITSRHRKEVSKSITGIITSRETGEPVRGALVMIGEQMAITDEEGRYRLRRVPSRTVYLRLDAASIGYDQVPMRQMPIEIGPDDLPTGNLDLEIASAASLDGLVQIFGYSGALDKTVGARSDSLVIRGGLFGAVLELHNSVHRYRTRSDPSGGFRFDRIPPGTYLLKVVRAPMNKYQRLRTKEVKVILEAGASSHHSFKVLPARQKINFLQSSSLSTGKLSDSVQSGQPEGFPAVRAGANSGRPTDRESDDGIQDSWMEESHSSLTAPPVPIATPWYELLEQSSVAVSKRGIPRRYQGSLVSDDHSHRRLASLRALLFVFCLLFVIVDIDIILNRSFFGRGSTRNIQPIKANDWILSIWKLSALLMAISSCTLFWGALAGFSAALGLAGLSVIIFNAESSRLPIAWVLVRLSKRYGHVLQYHGHYAVVRSTSSHSVQIELLDKRRLDLPLSVVWKSLRRPRSNWNYRLDTVVMSFSRRSDLRVVRNCLSTAYQNSDIPSHIVFDDVDTEWTRAHVRIIVEKNRLGDPAWAHLATNALQTQGIRVSEIAVGTQELTPVSDGHSTSSGRRVVPHMRLVKTSNQEAA